MEWMMFNFGGIETGRATNVIPFKTIFSYLLGEEGYLIAAINLVGNIILLIPFGLLMCLVLPNMIWKKSLILAVTT